MVSGRSTLSRASASPRNRLTMSMRLAALLSPLRHFWYLRLAADKVWTARPGRSARLCSSSRRRSDTVHTDRRGNNRIDGLKNLVEDPRVALIFLVPGVNETYRVNGRAQISQDADLKRRFAVNGKEPATIMVVTVEETFQHCAKALVRSDLWKAGSLGRPQGVPAIGDFVAARNPEVDGAAFTATYNERIPGELY